MYVNKEYKEIIERKYAEAKEANLDEIVLDEKLGELKLFINKKPQISFGTFIMEDGAEVSVGGNLPETAS